MQISGYWIRNIHIDVLMQMSLGLQAATLSCDSADSQYM